jgi:hypothetical protein
MSAPSRCPRRARCARRASWPCTRAPASSSHTLVSRVCAHAMLHALH